MMLYKNTKLKALSPDRDILLWYCRRCLASRYVSPIPVHNLPRLRTSNVDRSNERKWLYIGKSKKQMIPAQTMTNADYADDKALLANTPAQAESSLHNLEQAAGGIVLHVNADKTEYMCFNQNQTRDISTLQGGSLKLSSVSSMENDINTRLAKAWTAINRLTVIWKSDPSDKIKQHFF